MVFLRCGKSRKISISPSLRCSMFFSNGGELPMGGASVFGCGAHPGKSTQTGVLLIQLRYSALTELFSHVSLGSNGYVYLTDSDGCLLYHPFLQRMDGKQETAYRVLAEKGTGPMRRS